MSTDSKTSAFKTVFLDRDGVLNRKMPEGMYVRSLDELEILPGIAEAIGKLNRAAIRVLVASNQRGVALGHCTCSDVDAIHDRIQQHLNAAGAKIDRFYFCPHNTGMCLCRKPSTGMFERARTDFPQTDPSTSVMVGDSPSDIEFGKRAGMYTVLIRAESNAESADEYAAVNRADATCRSLGEAVDHILGRVKRD